MVGKWERFLVAYSVDDWVILMDANSVGMLVVDSAVVMVFAMVDRKDCEWDYGKVAMKGFYSVV